MNSSELSRTLQSLIIIIAAAVMLPRASTVIGQTRGSAEGKRVLLEARYLGVGLSGIEGDRLVARIYSDGMVEYDDLKKLNNFPEYYQRTAQLSASELSALSTLLRSDKLASLSESFPTFSSTIDHRTDLTLRFSTGTQTREIRVENFKPELDGALKVYPSDLFTLACWAEFARKNARLQFFFEKPDFCCKKDRLC